MRSTRDLLARVDGERTAAADRLNAAGRRVGLTPVTLRTFPRRRPSVLRADDVERRSTWPRASTRVEAAFVAYSAGARSCPAVIHLDVPEAGGEIHVKAGHLHGAPAYAVKVASGFYGRDAAPRSTAW